MKIKPKRKNATNPPKALPNTSSDLRGWLAIAQFLGMPSSTVHRWAKDGMPVHREGRNVVASPEELNQWLQRTSGEAAGVHVATSGADLLRDLKASVAAQGAGKSTQKRGKDRVKPAVRSRSKKMVGK